MLKYWFIEHKRKIVTFVVAPAVIILLVILFFSIKPIIVLSSSTQTDRIIITFLKSPFINNKNIQIVVDPSTSFDIKGHSLFVYDLSISGIYLENTSSDISVKFINGKTKRVYVNKVMTNTFQKALNLQQISKDAQEFKDLVKEQYPYFELFPYITSTIEVKYEKPKVLTIYLSGELSQQVALEEIDKYLDQYDISIEILKNIGVTFEFKYTSNDQKKGVFNE